MASKRRCHRRGTFNANTVKWRRVHAARFPRRRGRRGDGRLPRCVQQRRQQQRRQRRGGGSAAVFVNTRGGGGNPLKFWNMPWGRTSFLPTDKAIVTGYKPKSGLPPATYQQIQWANF